MRAGSLFSGIGAFDLALERAGIQISWQCEIDPDCLSILARHFPEATRYDDIRSLDPGDLAPADVICAGWPCQDLSVAGRRAGLAGTRSGLFHELVRVVRELQPTWLLLENVPGLLSSAGGRDFAVVLDELGECGYGLAWRVLDARYFGVAQRRRRVWIVGRLGAPVPAEVLFEPESGAGDTTTSREARPRVAYSLAASARGTGDGHGNAWNSTYITGEDAIAPCQTRRYGKGTDSDATDALVYQCQGSNVGEMGTLRSGNGHVTGGVPFVTHTLRAEGCDASEDGTGRGTPLVLALSENQRGEVLLTEQSHQLTTGGGKPGQGYPAVQLGMAVRRLTPTECERLMALPDGWTAIGASGKQMSDSTRYRMCGNALVVSCAEWIARRIVAYEERR